MLVTENGKTIKKKRFEFQKHDGGRSQTKFKGTSGDCVTRSISIATSNATAEDYMRIYNELGRRQKEFLANTRSKKINKNQSGTARDGVYRKVYQDYLEDLGWTWVPTMKVGQGCQVHVLPEELPDNEMLILRVSKHLVCVDTHNNKLLDTYDCSRGGSRCVYGYFIKESE